MPVCPMFLTSIQNGKHYYAAYNCPQCTAATTMVSPSPLTTGCSSSDCQSKYVTGDERLVVNSEYVGFAGPPCLKEGLEPNAFWPEIKGITEHISTNDCRFKIPDVAGVPGKGIQICARLFKVRIRIAKGKPVEIRVGQELSHHPNLADPANFPLDVAVAKYVGQKFLFEVALDEETYSVLTVHRT